VRYVLTKDLWDLPKLDLKFDYIRIINLSSKLKTRLEQVVLLYLLGALPPRSCGQSFCFISIFVRVIVVVNFAFWVVFQIFFIVIKLDLWWWTVYALFSTYEWLNCVSNVIDIVRVVVCCVTETYCLFVFLICFLYCWEYINYIKVVESTFCFWIFFLQFSCVSCVY